jgi:hypothetical protein
MYKRNMGPKVFLNHARRQPIFGRRGNAVAGLLAALTFACGCQTSSPPESATKTPSAPVSVPAPASTDTGSAAPERTSVSFVDVASRAGLTYRWRIAGPKPIDILQGIGNGCAFLDFNADGNLDTIMVGQRLALYLGDGRGHFTDATHATALDRFHGHFLGCAVGDYDNDGFDDLYISGYHEGLLLHNEGGAGLRDTTAAMGLGTLPWSSSCGFADMDGDGYLDLFVCCYIEFGPKSRKYCDYISDKKKKLLGTCGPLLYDSIKGRLYHNTAGRGFTDVTGAWGLTRMSGKGLGVAFADFDGTGTTDLAIANDMAPSNAFKNLGGGSLADVSESSGVSVGDLGEPYAGMGIDFGDYNNDGLLDLFATTFDYEQKELFRNEGEGVFSNASLVAGFTQSALPYVSFGCKFLDANNDGWLDLIVASGHVVDIIHQVSKTVSFRQPVQYFQNIAAPASVREGLRETRVFANGSHAAGVNKLAPIVGRGLATGDYDNDGRIDVLIVDSDGAPYLLHNESDPTGGWAGFRLRGAGPINRDGYGALLTVETAGQKLVRQCAATGSYLSSSDPRVHFGLGAATAIDRLTVRWPDGKQDEWTNVPVGAYFDLSPGKRPGER